MTLSCACEAPTPSIVTSAAVAKPPNILRVNVMNVVLSFDCRM
jgi:hypothetical protein